jgi:16S rRNA (guanine1516-N2)-methyltransferase
MKYQRTKIIRLPFTAGDSPVMLNPDIAVAALDPARIAEAEKLAAELDLPMAGPGDQYHMLLRYTGKGLELVKQGDPNLAGPVRVEFTIGKAAFRRQQQKQEMLVRAIGFKGGALPTVVDGTGGMGRDSFIMAAAGCRVQIFEREPVVAALLADGLKRALVHPATTKIAQRIRLTACDTVYALLEMQRNGQRVDVVYLDPMFPERRKSARVKKELQMLQMLTSEDLSCEQLLATALETAAKRVVVKRPRRAPCLTGRSPSHCLTGKTIRFDVYQTSKIVF